jgi:hypothetical protein
MGDNILDAGTLNGLFSSGYLALKTATLIANGAYEKLKASIKTVNIVAKDGKSRR